MILQASWQMWAKAEGQKSLLEESRGARYSAEKDDLQNQPTLELYLLLDILFSDSDGILVC